ncbi:RNase HII [Leadbetterella byssophila DSM 17132]|uniref:Ribonuclease HII n=1 Tax=Leadbetterella byssophila (strain DSM 17132 / JCM 16389 / KACC 11308 / NBRC 106382 / 4M15) TaxID=649349 RepID=E4RVR6_LEAB4|nr:ribonuclease HII [Leadbetterella byssophila]ADQ17964.1 RNase HII [Leadbetterella byssophila DSM 17132]
MLRPCYNSSCIEAGVDEAGRGCLAGPVVAAAVILPPGYENEWLNDSKQLSKEDRNQLRTEIENIAVAFAVGQASHEEIDKINILQASFLAMHRAIEQLSTRPDHLLIDGNRFSPYPLIPHTCIVKGDAKFMNIAAASILAKTYRDEIMEILSQEYPQYKWEANAGYPTIFHRKAIQEHGFTPYHRMTFRVKV